MKCPGCAAERTEAVEHFLTEDIARVWEPEVPEAAAAIRRYVAERGMPREMATRQCLRCRLEFFAPSYAAGPDWYEAVERYRDRWEYGETIADLGPPGRLVLELGCGEGIFLARAAEAGHRAVGLDFNRRAVARARAAGLDADAADLRSFAERTGEPPDAVALFHVIEHIESLDDFFADLAEVARPGTQLHISCPSPRRYGEVLFPQARVGLREVWDYPPHHQTRWSRSAIEALLSRMGWQLVRYAEEPFDWRGAATLRALESLETRKEPGPLVRRAVILEKLIETAPARVRCSGTSLYCFAVLGR